MKCFYEFGMSVCSWLTSVNMFRLICNFLSVMRIIVECSLLNMTCIVLKFIYRDRAKKIPLYYGLQGTNRFRRILFKLFIPLYEIMKFHNNIMLVLENVFHNQCLIFSSCFKCDFKITSNRPFSLALASLIQYLKFSYT